MREEQADCSTGHKVRIATITIFQLVAQNKTALPRQGRAACHVIGSAA